MTQNCKIFNLSLPKTATTSFGKMMTANQKKVCDGGWKDNKTNYLVGLASNKDIKEVIRFTTLYDVFCDIPWGGYTLYKDIHYKVRSSKFILISRPTDEWYKSLIGEIDKLIVENTDISIGGCEELSIADKIEKIYSIGCYGFTKMLEDLAGTKSISSTVLKSRKEKYETKVRRFFKGKENFIFKELSDFIKLERDLVEFLEIKEASLPHLNKKKVI